MRVSVLILTLNEEVNLPGCLESVAWCDDVVVLDSYSTDRTQEIARSVGARFVQRRFDNYACHRNWAFENIQFRHPWVLSLDADERCTCSLLDEILRLDGPAGDSVALYRIRRRDYLFGTWFKRSSCYPIWLGRLARPQAVRMEDRLVNAHAVTDGPIGYLRGHLVHYPFKKGIADWLDRHNRYSTMEAVECLKEAQEGGTVWQAAFSHDPIQKRRALKRLSFRLPFRPWLKLFYIYVLRRGFLDGGAGLTYCALQAVYEYMICLKIKELRRRCKGLPV